MVLQLPETPYQSYVYSYPHKTAYRPLDARLPLRDAWAAEDKSALFLYMHVPFCEMRCGFCNLFTTVHPNGDLVTAYLDALDAQADRVRDALGDDFSIARMAVGGGTPTYLTADELHRLFAIPARYGVDFGEVPTSVETSPATATPDRLAVLKAYHVDRVSIGVQSFIEAEAHAAGRPQKGDEVHTALKHIRAANFPTLNIDLIYGIDGQTGASWMHSIETALDYAPEEIYLYPLYVRPLTGLGKQGGDGDDDRITLYRVGRERLLEAGYVQTSMRMFRRGDAPAARGAVYCCQTDGMVGLGCGARSYTRGLHYASEYAVSRQPVLGILRDWIARDPAWFDDVHYGFYLDENEQRLRFVLQSLLQAEGLSEMAYRFRFGTMPCDDLPVLGELMGMGLAEHREGHIVLTPAGLERSDAVGPALFSDRVNELMAGYKLR